MRSEAICTDKDRQNRDWEGVWDAADPARDAWGVNFTRWKGYDSEQFGGVS